MGKGISEIIAKPIATIIAKERLTFASLDVAAPENFQSLVHKLKFGRLANSVAVMATPVSIVLGRMIYIIKPLTNGK